MSELMIVAFHIGKVAVALWLIGYLWIDFNAGDPDD